MKAVLRNILTSPRQLQWVAAGWASLWLCLFAAPGKDWPQWGGADAKNMVSEEVGLPDSFVPGEKDSLAGQIKLETTKNVKWAVKLCSAIYSTPVVAGGKILQTSLID